jgi:hypothetical protein
MLIRVFVAAAALLSQQAPPEPAIYVVYGDDAALGSQGNVQRLLNEWRETGIIRGDVRRVSLDSITACIGRRPNSPIDQDCIRRLATSSGRSVIAIVARDAGRAAPFLNLTCIGPRASGRGSVNVNHGGAFASVPQHREAARQSVRGCIDAARGPASALSFDNWGRVGDFAYHRVSGDCDLLRHRIGRNATRGSHSAPLRSIRLVVEAPTRVRLQCLRGTCITSIGNGQTLTRDSHQIDFETASAAAGYVRQVNDLRRACSA